MRCATVALLLFLSLIEWSFAQERAVSKILPVVGSGKLGEFLFSTTIRILPLLDVPASEQGISLRGFDDNGGPFSVHCLLNGPNRSGGWANGLALQWKLPGIGCLFPQQSVGGWVEVSVRPTASAVVAEIQISNDKRELHARKK